MTSREYVIVSGILFGLVALAHLIRVAYGIAVSVDGYTVPMFLSWIGFIVPGALAFWAFRQIRSS